jgi:hypothetical protein
MRNTKLIMLHSLCTSTPAFDVRTKFSARGLCYAEQPKGRLGENPSGNLGQQTDRMRGAVFG